MKKKSSQQVRVGIFVTLGIILTMVAIFLLGNLGGIFERYTTLYARFDDISGLRIAAPVYLAGINVGKIEDIRFPTQLEEKKVVVKLKIKENYDDRLRTDSEASIVTQGLLGDKAVFLTVGSPAQPQVKEGGELQVKESMTLESISSKGGEILTNVNELAKNMNEMLGEVRNKEGLLHAVLYDPKGKDIINDLSGILTETKSIMGDAKGVMREISGGSGMLHQLIYEKPPQNLAKNLSDTVDNFNDISKDLKSVSGKIESGEGSIGGLVNDPTVYYDLMTLLGGANRSKLLKAVIRSTISKNEKDLIGKEK